MFRYVVVGTIAIRWPLLAGLHRDGLSFSRVTPVNRFPLRRYCFAALLGTTASLLGMGGIAAQKPDVEPDLNNRFRDEAASAWDQIRRKLGTLQVTFALTSTLNGKRIQDEAIEIERNENCKMHSYQSSHIKNEQLLRAYNPTYSFYLTRNGPDKGWVLKYLDLKEQERKARTREVEKLVNESLFSTPIRLGQVDLGDLIKQPSFKLVSVRSVKKNDVPLVEVSFTNKHPFTAKPFSPIQGGTLYLDPRRSWCLRSAIVDTQHSNGSGQAFYDLTYTGHPADSFVPRELVIRTLEFIIPDGKTIAEKQAVEMRLRAEFKVNGSDSTPGDEQFYLSAFGLPEPIGIRAPTPPSRWNLWIGAAGFGTLALLFLLRKFLKEPRAIDPAAKR